MRDPLEEAGVEVNSGAATGVLVAVVAGLVALGVFVPGSRTALALIVGIILLIMLHEFGHYWTAKRAGMKVTEFFLGFGPRLWSFRRGETEYGVKAIPAGGYVRIIGMSNLEEVDPDDEPRTFRQGSTGKRLMVILAGVTVNLFIAFLLFFVIIAGQGRVADGPSTTVGPPRGRLRGRRRRACAPATRSSRSTAAQVDGWDQLKTAIEKNGGQTVTITVERNGTTVDLTATLKEKNGAGLPRRRSRHCVRERRRARRDPQGVHHDGRRHRGDLERARRPIHAVGRADHREAELHQRGARGRFDRRSVAAAEPHRLRRTTAARSPTATCGRSSGCSAR